MRKVILIIGMLLCSSSMLMAQASTTTVSSTGNDNDVDIEQVGKAQTADVLQDGDENDVDVFQEGEEDASHGVGDQSTAILQDGYRNKADVKMQQLGSGGKTINISTVEQLGNDNEVDQDLYAPGSNSGQRAYATQDGNRNFGRQNIYTGHTETLTLEQMGNDNRSEQFADGGHITAEVYQTGNNNDADQSIAGSNWGYSGALVRITQLGNDNDAEQDLSGGGSTMWNHAVIVQDGNRNEAEQSITKASPAAEPVDAEIHQSGNDNHAEQAVSGGNSVKDKLTVTFDIDQVGHRNQATQDATGVDHEATILQQGNDNVAEQKMSGASDAFADFLQQGNENRAKLVQTGVADWADFDQLGNHNTIRGLGGDQWARQADGSTATVLQDGHWNMLKMFQEGGADTSVTQDGNNNSAVVNQHGG